MSELLVVAGHPIGHSLSPAMHTAALRALGLSERVRYEARDVPPDALAGLVAELRDGRLRGANLTLPHKRAILPLCDRVEPDAAAIGAVNTLVRDADAIVGVNTDAPGLVAALAHGGVGLDGAKVLVLGAGGAARAAVVGLRGAGAASVHVAARRETEARSLARELGAEGGVELSREALEPLCRSLDLVVQATSASLDPVAAVALAASVPWAALPARAVVCDLVYRPRTTAVLREAAARGLRALDGTEMLVRQGALALGRWLQVEPPTDAMRDAVHAAL